MTTALRLYGTGLQMSTAVRRWPISLA